jgi:putative radical SAM enzyme (TIGR03279 family)
MEKIDRLTGEGIDLHTQIVVCPGLIDGAVLERSIRDLGMRYPGVHSVAVVPVGLTEHRAGLFPLHPVDAALARATIGMVDRLRTEYREETGVGFAYCSDEWYIRAGMEIPEAEYYDEFPQIENGVGMVRDFLDAANRLESVTSAPRFEGKITLVTGVSMAGYIGDFARKLAAHTGREVRAVAVPNRFYGETVTVSGLLTGGDIRHALEGDEPHGTIVLPPNCLNSDGLFLDDFTPDDLARACGAPVVQGTYDPIATFFDDDDEEDEEI